MQHLYGFSCLSKSVISRICFMKVLQYKEHINISGWFPSSHILIKLLFRARCHICAVYFPTIWLSTVHVKILFHICVLNNIINVSYYQCKCLNTVPVHCDFLMRRLGSIYKMYNTLVRHLNCRHLALGLHAQIVTYLHVTQHATAGVSWPWPTLPERVSLCVLSGLT